MNILQISDEHFIGKGRQKSVYLHPDDPSKCVKFPKEKAKKNLNREIKYTRKHQEQLEFISPYRGVVKTNRGAGFVFDLISDPNGEPSKSLEDWSERSDVPANLQGKIEVCFHKMLKHKAAVSELEPCNILMKMKDDGDYDLVIIDGFGNSDFIKICDFSAYFLHQKLVRKFAQFCKNMNLSRRFLDESLAHYKTKNYFSGEAPPVKPEASNM